MERRALLMAVVAGVAGAPLRLFAQAPKPWRIGILAARSRPSSPGDPYDAFAQGMSDMGYVEGKSYVFDWVYAWQLRSASRSCGGARAAQG